MPQIKFSLIIFLQKLPTFWMILVKWNLFNFGYFLDYDENDSYDHNDHDDHDNNDDDDRNDDDDHEDHDNNDDDDRNNDDDHEDHDFDDYETWAARVIGPSSSVGSRSSWTWS